LLKYEFRTLHSLHHVVSVIKSKRWNRWDI